jgi:hypothetical protein
VPLANLKKLFARAPRVRTSATVLAALLPPGAKGTLGWGRRVGNKLTHTINPARTKVGKDLATRADQLITQTYPNHYVALRVVDEMMMEVEDLLRTRKILRCDAVPVRQKLEHHLDMLNGIIRNQARKEFMVSFENLIKVADNLSPENRHSGRTIEQVRFIEKYFVPVAKNIVNQLRENQQHFSDDEKRMFHTRCVSALHKLTQA